MIQVCCYKGCGVIYGEKEPLSDKSVTHGLCSKHYAISLKELGTKIEKLTDRTGTFRVLIVEDSTVFRQLFKEALHNRFPSAEVYETTDGAESLLQVEELRPNLIFMDIRLPGENGLQLTQKIKDKYPNITVIILTSYDSLEYREAAIRSGGDAYISKDSLAYVHLENLVKSLAK
jgi:CheY-like chemotaxis protein